MNEPIRGEVTRNYYSSDYFTLPEDEPRRAADPFVEKGNPCPKCGYSDRIIWYYSAATRCMVAECRCGYLKEQYIGDALPMTDGLRLSEGINIIKQEVICAKCGKSFRTRADNPKKVCQRCRNGKITAQWQKAHPEQYKETQRRHQGLKKQAAEKKREAGKEFL